ncbi:Calx-beta domain-containing protein [Vibrio navarrensis]|uniref:Calx-beta domain-containing protein n=1 Tax=Vibrio navarrensis TaxID=29495 RepID=UPI001869F9C3|nr:Calx-beta domain-containing protein [Vibrio navarrensis]MBE4582750.1 hypothetical protein [Vibrio navarrensis]
MQKTTLALMVASTILLAGCGGGSSSSNPVNEPSAPVVVPPTAPDYPERSSLAIKVLDDQGGELTNATIAVLSDPSQLVTQLDGQHIQLDQSKFHDRDVDGLLDYPLSLVIQVAAPGYLSQRASVVVSDFGVNQQSIELLSLTSPQLSQAGVFYQSSTLKLAAEPLASSGLIEVNAQPESPLQTVIKISPQTQWVNQQGEAVNAETVQIEQIAYPSDSAKLPLSAKESAANLAQYNSQAGTQLPVGSEVRFRSLAVIDIKITSENEALSKIVAGQPLAVQLSLSNEQLNPTTGQPLKVGDKIPVWSLSEQDSRWVFEQFIELEQGAFGELSATFTTRHLTQFNLAFAEVSDTCSGYLLVRNERQQPLSQEGDFSFSSARFFAEDHYLGAQDGRIAYSDVPNELTDITFNPQEKEVTLNHTLTTTAHAGSERGQTLLPLTLKGVNLCQASGSTLVFNQGQPMPFVRISPSSAYQYLVEGDAPSRIELTAELINPGEDDVQLSYQVASRYGATDGEDFVAKQEVLALSAEHPTATIQVDVLGDEEPETYYEALQLSMEIAEGASFESGTQKQEKTYYIRDDDSYVVENLQVLSASEADQKAVVEVTLDRKMASGNQVYLYYRVYSTAEDTASAFIDYPQIQSGYSQQPNALGGISSVLIPSGQRVFRFDVPIIDDLDVENQETFTLEMVKTRFVTSAQEKVLTSVTIADNDSAVAEPSRVELYLTQNTVNEGRFLQGSLRLDTATDRAVNVTVSSENMARLRLGSIDNTEPLNIQFMPGEASKLLVLIVPDNRAHEAHQSIGLTIANDVQLPVITRQIEVRDDDDIYISLNVEQSPDQVFEDSSGNVLWRFGYYNTQAQSADDIVAAIALSANSTATLSEDFNLDLPASLVFSNSSRPEIQFDLIADDSVEPSEWVTLDFTTQLPQGSRVRYDLPGCYDAQACQPGKSYTFSQTLVIGNDDLMSITIPMQRNVKMDPDSQGDFIAQQWAEGIEFSISDPLDFELVFDVELMASDLITMPYLTIPQQITLPAGQKVAKGTLDFAAVTRAELDQRFNQGTVKLEAMLNVQLSEESREKLKKQGVQFVVTNSQMNFTFSYPQVDPTGATGGSGGEND